MFKLNATGVNDKITTNSNMYSYEMILMDYKEYRINKCLLLYMPPIILVIGIFGNIFAFIILRQSMSRISTYFYLAILALADLIVLIFGLLRLWVKELTDVDLRDQSEWTCKVIITVLYTCSIFSVWLIVAVTVERYIAVCHPLQASILCSVQRAKAVTIVIFVVLLAIHSHFLWTVGLSYTVFNTSSVATCEGLPQFSVLVHTVWPWVDSVLYSLLPSLILFILNCLIIRQVYVARKCRSQLQHCKSGRNIYLSKSLPTEGSIKLSLMLLTVSFAFMITTLPKNASLIVETSSSEEYTYRQIANSALSQTVTTLLMYLNHSINFFLYCATGKKFRKTMERLVCKFKHVRRSLNENSPNSLLLTRYSFSVGRLSINNFNQDVRIARLGSEIRINHDIRLLRRGTDV